MAREVENTQDMIDSRDVIERLEELQTEKYGLEEALAEAVAAYKALGLSGPRECSEEQAADEAQEALDEWGNRDEYNTLSKLADEASISPDWEHGEQLIRDSHFQDYIEELINDCYELPKDFNSGDWPWRHMKIDYEAAAAEAQSDYFSVDFDGVDYWIRG